MLSRLSIGRRIYLGFVLMGVLSIALASAALVAAGRAQSNASHFRQLNARTFALLEMQTEVTALQRSVQLFSTLGHASLADESLRRIADLRVRFETTESLLSGRGGQRLLARMRTSLDNYEASLTTAIDERRIRYALVHDELPTLERRLEALGDRPEAVPAERWQRLVRARSRLESSLYRYLYEPDYALLTGAVDEVEALETIVESPAEREYLALLDAYAKKFRRVVQATRGYLYLVGVVMAGEAWEFSRLSTKLRDDALADVPAIVRTMETMAGQMRRRTLLVGALALIGGLAFSWAIGRSISKPLQQIAETLDRLARGERVPEVPGGDRKDEIGVMAVAAEAFRRANDETEALLGNQIELSDKLETHQRALQRSNLELEQFVYTVSHDLKTPLVTSLGFIGMMRELAADGEVEEALSQLDVLERSNRKMSRLLTDLLQLSRVGRVDAELQTVDPNAVAKEMLALLDARLEKEGITVHVGEDIPPVRANPTRFEQVLENLISNAIKYGRPEHGPFEVSVDGRELDDGRVEISVTDRGPGIAPAHHERVFGLFNRLSSGGDGTGIGLAIVKRVMETSGGEVRLVSQGTGDGCRFELVFDRGDV